MFNLVNGFFNLPVQSVKTMPSYVTRRELAYTVRRDGQLRLTPNYDHWQTFRDYEMKAHEDEIVVLCCKPL